MKQKLVNWEIAVYALYLSGGTSTLVHTEDVALKSFELASGSFSWVRYPQHPDKDIVRVALTDARKARIGALVSGRAGKGRRRVVPASRTAYSSDGWMLTETGIAWVLANETRLTEALGQKTPTYHRQAVLQKVRRVRQHRLFEAYTNAEATFRPSLGELADLLRCRVDAERLVWRKRIELMRNQALLSQQQDVLAFVNACAARLDQLLHNGASDDDAAASGPE